MLSRIFQYIANRNTFYNPWLNTQTPFSPVIADPSVDKLRSILNLDKTNLESDYFVTSLANILVSNHTISHTLDLELDIQPEIWKKIQTEKIRSLSSGWFISNSQDGPANNNRKVGTWPVELEVSVIKLNDTTARVKSGGLYADVRVVFTNNNRLEIEWPDWVGINGVLITEDPTGWDAAGKLVTLFVPPKNYPIKAVVERLKYDTAFLDVLEKRGFLSYYAGADVSDSEKLSIVVYCLYLDTGDKLKERI